jgi:hypothetical protein
VFDTMFGDHTFAGVEMNVVSAITNTLWDLKGRFCNLPVYQPLGGSRQTLGCYATTYGMPVDTIDVELLKAEAVDVLCNGKGGRLCSQIGPGSASSSTSPGLSSGRRCCRQADLVHHQVAAAPPLRP